MTTSQQIESMKQLNQGAAALLIGVSARTFRDLDAPRSTAGTYNAREVTKWSEQRNAETLDLIGNDSNSPALERYHNARASAAELDLAERQGVVVATSDLRTVHNQWSAILRRAGERLKQSHGTEAHAILNEALDECGRIVKQLPNDDSEKPAEKSETQGKP